MPITTFDTLKYVRRLEQAGMSPELAEVQAEVLTEAFTVNLESLVTREYLESRLDARFAEQRAYIDTCFAKQDARIDSRFADQEGRVDTGFAELKADFDGKFRTLYVMFAVIMAGVILPYLERILAL